MARNRQKKGIKIVLAILIPLIFLLLLSFLLAGLATILTYGFNFKRFLDNNYFSPFLHFMGITGTIILGLFIIIVFVGVVYGIYKQLK